MSTAPKDEPFYEDVNPLQSYTKDWSDSSDSIESNVGGEAGGAECTVKTEAAGSSDMPAPAAAPVHNPDDDINHRPQVDAYIQSYLQWVKTRTCRQRG